MITLFLGPICFTGLQVLSDVGVTIVIMLVSIRLCIDCVYNEIAGSDTEVRADEVWDK